MPNSLRSFVVSLRNAVLRRKPKPLQDANFSITGTADPDYDVDNPSISHGQPPPLSTIASYGPVNNGELSSSTYPHPCHPIANFEANLNDTTSTSQGSDKTSDAQVGSNVDVVKRVRLPDYLQRKPSLASIAQVAYDRRARRAAVKENAERRVKLCEEQLQFFRQELSNAERELQEVESNVQGWQKFFSKFEPVVDVEDVAGAGGTGPAIVRHVDTDPSSFLGFQDNINHMHNVGSVSPGLNINISSCSSPASSSDYISDH